MAGLVRASCVASLGCGAPEEQIIARESPIPAPAPVPIEPIPSPSVGPRGRVVVRDGQLRSDIGTPLRGLLLPVDFGWTLDKFDLITSIAETTGLNTVHVYLENWTHVTGVMQSEADALVSLTAQAGLYLVLGIGGGPSSADHPGNGWFDLEKVRSFWSLYADRYKDSSHVLYEIQNGPESVCDQPMQAATLDMEREAYALIRSAAPDTHVVLFSINSIPTEPVLADAITRVSDVVDWSNASIGIHTERVCTPIAQFGTLVDSAARAGVPLLMSQLARDGWETQLPTFERYGVGWLQYNWFSTDLEISTLRDETARAGVTWCPDRGTYPMAAEACRTL